MRQGSQWIGGNAARFAALWFAALTLGALVIPGEGQWFPAPHSLPGLLTLPFALCVMVFLAAAAAFVALVAFTPVLVLWLAVYLAVIFGLMRALQSEWLARPVTFTAAPALWVPFVHAGDRLVDDVSLVIICVYGLLVRPWPTRPPARSHPAKPGQVA
jgi:hypothetical protein